MPVVGVKMWEGRTEETKAKLVSGITDVFISLGTPASAVTVILTEYSKTNWGEAGKLSAK